MSSYNNVMFVETEHPQPTKVVNVYTTILNDASYVHKCNFSDFTDDDDNKDNVYQEKTENSKKRTGSHRVCKRIQGHKHVVGNYFNYKFIQEYSLNYESRC